MRLQREPPVRDGESEHSAWSEHTSDFGKHRVDVSEVLDDLDRGDHFEVRRRKRELLRGLAQRDDVCDACGRNCVPKILDAPGLDIDADDLLKSWCKRKRVGTVPAAYV
jgi:hypothetical protein